MKYDSLTTEGIQHDAANLLTEFIWLNKDYLCGAFPWSNKNSKTWGKIVAALKKLMREPYGLSKEQLAFYIWKCKPRFIDPPQFAKMAVVARRLLDRYDLENVSELYRDYLKNLKSSGLENLKYKQDKPKSIITFLRELEYAKK